MIEFNETVKFLLDYLANYALPFRVTVGFITIFLMCAVVVYQAYETIKFRHDHLSSFRWGVLVTQILIVVTMIPTQFYLYMRMIGIENENLRNLSTVSGGFAPFGFTVAFIILYIITRIVNNRK